MQGQAAENKIEITNEQKQELGRVGSTLKRFLIADGVLVLFLTAGFLSPKMTNFGSDFTVMAASEYQGKSSPLDVPREPARERAPKIPRLSARTMPLPVEIPINASLTPPPPQIESSETQPAVVSKADAEADLTMPKRRT